MRRLGVIVVCLACFLFAGTAVAAKFVTVNGRSNGKTITVKKGYMLRVRLAANPSTGYSWYVTQLDRALRPNGSRYVPRRPIRAGSGGTMIRDFLATKVGRTRLRMLYARARDKRRPARRFTLTVVVKSAL